MILNSEKHKIYNEHESGAVTERKGCTNRGKTQSVGKDRSNCNQTNSFTNVSKKFPGKKSICYNKNNLQYNQIPLASSPCSVHNFVERREKIYTFDMKRLIV